MKIVLPEAEPRVPPILPEIAVHRVELAQKSNKSAVMGFENRLINYRVRSLKVYLGFKCTAVLFG
jgi:hypothetical protein